MQGGAPVVKGVFKNPDSYDRLLCLKCKHLLWEPVQLCCGHRFCKSCADEILSEATTPQCPDCGEDKITDEVRAPHFPDLSIPKDIKVMCLFREDGYQWEGKYQDYGLHINTCKFKPTCPLSTLGCSNTPMSKFDLECHLSSHRGEHLNIMVNGVSVLQEQCNTVQEFDNALRNLEVTSTLHCILWGLALWGYLEQPYETLLELLRELQPPEQKILVKLLQGLVLQPLQQVKLLHQLEMLQTLNRPKLLRLLDGLEPVEQVKLVDLLKRLEPREHCSLLRLLDGLEPMEQQHRLLSVLEGLKLLDQRKLLTLLEGLKAWEQWKLLELMEDLEKLKRKKLLRLLEEMEPVKLLKLLERVGPQERKNFYQLLVLLEPLKLKMLLELELTRLERLGSEVERLERLKLQGPLEAYKRLLQLLVEWLSVYLSEDGDHRGGFRNLLLDGWWLEFWEIILLAAGDVERNPGPRRITDEQLATVDNRVLGKGDLFCVLEAGFECRTNWFNLCLALQLSHGSLSAIGTKHTSDITACLREGLAHWLQGDYDTEKYGPPTWRMLVAAVDNSCGGNDQTLALEIAKEHKAIQTFEVNTPHQTRNDCSDLKHSKQMSSAFSKLYRSIICHLSRVDVSEAKEALRYCSQPHSLHQRCVPPSVYQDTTSTKDLLDRLYPEYINPQDTFVLEEIVDNCGSRQCKRLLREYTTKFL